LPETALDPRAVRGRFPGLAAGAAMFALSTMFVVGSINGQAGPALVTIALAGATLGFLVYNFNPASIFLGDSGSLFLGFMLAGIGLLGSQKSPTVIAVAIPIVSLGLPVLDTTLAVARRFLRGQPIFTADRAHIHHRLLSLGHSPRRVALLHYSACALLGLGGMLLVNDSAYVAVVLVVIGRAGGPAAPVLRVRGARACAQARGAAAEGDRPQRPHPRGERPRVGPDGSRPRV
jgi:UDP-GlcNAc:undecaprenyl-phosphate GlcNAc-1-phosphate transferase